jgi:DNA topoisomerase-2
MKKISNNQEINDIKKILGLETGKKYSTQELINTSLRYGKVIFMTDQDLDGTHIKGLCINMFDSQWSELLKLNTFLGFMNTPILKAKKGNKELCFYNDKEYETWKHMNSTKGWNIKYYKGLGTSTSKEFKEYFKHKKVIDFMLEETCREELDKVFRKTRSDDRKYWLNNYNKDSVLDTNNPTISYSDFVNQELIHFSKYDNERSIPNIMDGLKTSLRKILYCAFKRNLIKEIKVAQFGGYVSEHSGYHHGEKSLMDAIVGMAQEYVGSNNINLLLPNGQFGTRLQGGSDSASERYIFTMLNQITKYIYRESDGGILNYLDDDGTSVEPEFYVPIIPMILVNGTSGIGTGFSTDIMCYNPLQIIEYIQKYLLGENTADVILTPYYNGFKGDIIKIEEDRYMFKGKYNIISKNIIHITELPIGTWTENYKVFLEKLLNPCESKQGKKTKSILKDYKDMSTDTSVDITITFQNGELEKLLNQTFDHKCNGVDNKLNLTTTRKTTNMHLFNEKQQLRKFKTVKDIIDYYIPIRLSYYTKRKEFLIEKLQREVCLLTNKARFIEEQCNDTLDLRRKKKGDIIQLLMAKKYDTIDNDDEYKYLRIMPIDSVSEENINKLLQERDNKQNELQILKSTTEKHMWRRELSELSNEYIKYTKTRTLRQNGESIKLVKKVKKIKKIKKL